MLKVCGKYRGFRSIRIHKKGGFIVTDYACVCVCVMRSFHRKVTCLHSYTDGETVFENDLKGCNIFQRLREGRKMEAKIARDKEKKEIGWMMKRGYKLFPIEFQWVFLTSRYVRSNVNLFQYLRNMPWGP